MICAAIAWSAPANERRKRTSHLIDCSAKLKKVLVAYSKKRFGEVEIDLAEMKTSCSGHDAMDSIIYFLGMAYLLDKKPEEAKYEFQEIMRDFPKSSFFEEAHFRIGHCSYAAAPTYERDQADTREAIRQLAEFLDAYGDSRFADSARYYIAQANEKLAKKEFMNARFYDKISEFEAAIIYYKTIVSDYPGSKYVPEAKLQMAQDLVKVRRPAEAVQVLDEILSESAPDDIRIKAKALKDRLGAPG
jgi:outer membrane protein assembly factor BamD